MEIQTTNPNAHRATFEGKPKPQEDNGLLPAVQRHTDLLNMLEVLGSKPSEADKLRGAVIEALHWLEVNAPSRAHEVLRTALITKTT